MSSIIHNMSLQDQNLLISNDLKNNTSNNIIENSFETKALNETNEIEGLIAKDDKTMIGIRLFNNIYDSYKIYKNDSDNIVNDFNGHDINLKKSVIVNDEQKILECKLDKSNQLDGINDYKIISNDNSSIIDIIPTCNKEMQLINSDENENLIEFLDFDNLDFICEVNKTNEFVSLEHLNDGKVSRLRNSLDSNELIDTDIEFIEPKNECDCEDFENEFDFQIDNNSKISLNNDIKNPYQEPMTSSVNNKQKTKSEYNDNNKNIDSEYNNFQNYISMIKNIPKNLANNKDDSIILISDEENQNDDVDVISISSDDNLTPERSESDPDGYNSSDFEFIDEEEAKKNIIFPNSEIILDYFREPERNENFNYRENHIIPEGEDFVNLFNGNNNHLPTFCIENKSTSIFGMNVGFDRVGFDMRQWGEHPGQEIFEEAMECKKNILSMYPIENRRKRRRRY